MVTALVLTVVVVSCFKVIHRTHGIVLEVNRTGASQHLWYTAELSLPYSLGNIENPVFAAYPGGNWDNETFQKISVSNSDTLEVPTILLEKEIGSREIVRYFVRVGTIGTSDFPGPPQRV